MIKGDVFIVPNLSHKLGENVLKNGHKKKLEALGLSVDDNTVLVQVWITGSGSNNWADHGFPDEEHEYFTSFLPLDVLAGKKEGDVISLTYKGNVLSLTLRQQGYRYQSFGNFEDVLKLVVKENAAA